MVKVGAIFSDYDGTLCALEQRREDAHIVPRLQRLLTKASKTVKIGIVTTKDLDFIKERVPFAHGIAASCGLEFQIGDRIIEDDRVQKNEKVEIAYRETLKRILPIHDNIMIERKLTEDGNLLAFCIDWRLASDWDEAKRRAAPLLTYCKEGGLYVVESDVSPFANIFPFPVDKGSAFAKLRNEMGVTGPVMYWGDSEVDDPAFQLADVSIGINHRRIMPKLACKYRLGFFELENFLSHLIEADFEFKDTMAERNTQE